MRARYCLFASALRACHGRTFRQPRADFLFLAFALLALLHLFQSITSFNSGAPLGVEIEVMYSLISLLLLTGDFVSVVRRHGPTIGRSKKQPSFTPFLKILVSGEFKYFGFESSSTLPPKPMTFPI